MFSNHDAFIEYTAVNTTVNTVIEIDDGFKARLIIISEINTRRHLHLPAYPEAEERAAPPPPKQSLTKASQHIAGKNTVWVIHER